jgi:putative DNA primase/helicase
VIDLLEKLVSRPLVTSDATGAAIVRAIEAFGPSVLVDEHDSMAFADTLRNIYNSGFERGRKTIRRDGFFNNFAPFALASTNRLHPAMVSRSIVLRLQRKLPSEKIKPVTDFDGTNLRRRIARWLLDNRKALVDAQPLFPRGLTDRPARAWKPLLAIADRAGRRWPKMARDAAVALSTRLEPPSRAELLLADIKAVFGNDEALFSAELVKRLVAQTDAPWAGDGLNEWLLAQKLEPFGIYPKKMRLGSENKRGYRRDSFAEVWQRWQITPL